MRPHFLSRFARRCPKSSKETASSGGSCTRAVLVPPAPKTPGCVGFPRRQRFPLPSARPHREGPGPLEPLPPQQCVLCFGCWGSQLTVPSRGLVPSPRLSRGLQPHCINRCVWLYARRRLSGVFVYHTYGSVFFFLVALFFSCDFLSRRLQSSVRGRHVLLFVQRIHNTYSYNTIFEATVGCRLP